MTNPKPKLHFTRSDSAIGKRQDRGSLTPNVPISTGEHALDAWAEGERFAGRQLSLSRMAGAQQVHVNLVEVPPGKQSCPFHHHLREEEHFYVLSGRCMLRSGDDRHPMASGDYVCFPAGTGVAHCFVNPFDEPCTLLAIGPRDEAEIAVYPDSRKAKLRAVNQIIAWPQEPTDYWRDERADELLAGADVAGADVAGADVAGAEVADTERR